MAGLSLAPQAFADTATYANITGGVAPSGASGSATGTIGSVGFTYSGETDFVNLSNSGAFNYFNPVATYTSATVSNAPTDGALIALTGNGTTTNTITFATPVNGLILSEVSLGGNSHTSYTFDTPFVVLSCGPNATYGGGCFDQAVGSTSLVLSGQEVDGTIEFLGPISTLSFTTANGEFWNGFDLGVVPTSVSATPEPSSLILLGSGLLSGAGLLRRRLVRR